MRHIHLPFYPGDTVWIVLEDPPIQKCKICEGERTVEIGGKVYTCPECHGKGQFWAEHGPHKAFEGTVEEVRIRRNNDVNGFLVRLKDGLMSDCRLNDLHASEDSAKNAALKMDEEPRGYDFQ